MEKKNVLFLLTLVILTVITGCSSSKKIAYLQGSEELTAAEYAQTTPLYDARIMPKDLLTVVVTTTDPEASRPFNLIMPTVSQGISASSGVQGQLQTYLVDNSGQINFPVVGMITLKGLTKSEAEDKVKGLLRTYLKEDPVVTVRF